MRHPIIIKIVSSITLLVVFLLMPLTSHSDMLGALRRLERDTQHLEQPIRQHSSDPHLLKKPGEHVSDVTRPQPRNRKGRGPQRLQAHRPAFLQELKFAYQNRLPEFRKLSHRQARQERRGAPRPPKTPERILDKFVTRIQHSAVMTDASTGQHVFEELAVEPVAFSLSNHQLSSSLSENSSLPGTVSLHILSVLRL